MEVNFLNQNQCFPSRPGVFQFDIFFRVFLSSLMCISPFGPPLSPSTSLVILFIHSAFSLCFFRCHIFVQKRSISLASASWYVFVSCLPSCWLNFLSLFLISCFFLFFFFCIALPFVDVSLISLLSPELSGLFPQDLLLFFLVFSFQFCFHIFENVFVLPFWPVFVDFFICVSCRISHPGFDCFFGLIEGIPLFSHTNFNPASISSFNYLILFVDM